MTHVADPLSRTACSAPTVLVVDDSALFRAVATELCQHAGLEVVTTAADAETAIELLDAGTRADLVLMDVQLPGMSGPEATRVVTTRHPDVAVLLTSALDRTDVADVVEGSGALGFVSKGELDVDVLRRAVGGAGTPDGAGATP